MSSALDMTLDEMIKNNKKSGGGGGGGRGGRGRGGGGGDRSGTGPSRRFPNRSNNRSAPYSMGGKPVQAPGDSNSNWQHDMFTDPVAVAAVAAAAAQGGRSSSAIETGTKLYISNLDYGVSNEDIKELFSEVGDLKRHAVHYDRSGRSKGTAEVVFSRRVDAAAAVKRYNNVQLDGKPMKIEIVGTNIESPAFMPVVPNGIYGNLNGAPRGFPGRGRASSRLRGGGGGNGGRGSGSGRGRGRGRGCSEPPSVSDLDADLEKYHSEAMQIN